MTNPLAVLTPWAQTLELALVFACVHEAVQQLGLVTVADVGRALARIDTLVATLSRLDPTKVLEENAEALARFASTVPQPNDPATMDTATVVRTVQSLLIHCPIEALTRQANSEAELELAHRCRTAFEGLKAFVVRHTHPEQAALRAAGHVYAQARATIDEVAAMLGLPAPDAVALLEENGFRRTVQGLRLSDEERQARLARIRDDRVARDGQPSPSDERVARDVIASQRIEGIDARPWMRS